jgi:outer membrane protein assembly factor BamB
MSDTPGPAAVTDNVMLATTWSFTVPAINGVITDIAYSPIDGSVLWEQNRTVIPGSTSFGAHGPIGDGVYCRFITATKQWYAYSLTTGNLVWGPTVPYSNDWGSYEQASATIANGVLYAAAYDGEIHAYNMTNGNHLWDFSTPSAGYNTPYGVYPFYGLGSGLTVADGIIYIASSEHSPVNPLYQGMALYCVNATTGTEMWNVLGWYWTPIVADGEMVVANGADNQIYAFGQGPSKTTVTAPDIGVTTATPVTITGTVTDISAGSQQNAVAANFPNGLPCVSDASMSQFMEAVYMQQPMPTNMTGVKVTLTETDHNGNTYTIGSTTTNPLTGTWAYNWTPPIVGNYTITATFAGSGAYYGSYATTYTYASPAAPTPAPTASPPTGLASTSSLELGIAAVIIVIIVCVAVLAVLMLRKRP